MRRLLRLVAVLVVLGSAAAACTDEGGDDSSSSSTTQGSTVDEGQYQATIRRTGADGIPHITADTLASAAFGQGWASGEDHACSLADQVVKVRSERARWFGPGEDDTNINSDLAYLHLGLRARSETDLEAEPAEVRELLTGFVAGWNAYLEETGVDDLTGWCAGEPWVGPITELDLYSYARSVALLASAGQLIGPIATAQPPTGPPPTTTSTSTTTSSTTTTTAPTTTTETPSTGTYLPAEPPLGSNGWAIGADRTADGTGMLLANPHFPWEGELRFWEVQLTVPGELDVYGAQLLGLPGVGIGFTSGVAWTHTVSAGNRFTVYQLDLADGDPTSYVYDDAPRAMESQDYTIDVLGDDGETDAVTRTLWRTHYGPVINFPGLGWTNEVTLAYRDANIDNTTFFQQYLGMDRAQGLDELMAVHEEFNGVPLFNTIAVGTDGRAWYADTSATPNLSDEAIARWITERAADPFVSVAWDNGAVLLDGSDSMNEWVEEDGARSPGLVPYERLPQMLRDDYLFNANDSFWLANGDELLEGDYSPLHGEQGTSRSPRTRENARVLSDISTSGPAGEDGDFDLEELRAAALLNESSTAFDLRGAVVSRCGGIPSVELPAVPGQEDSPGLPAATIDLADACSTLADWDERYDVDSVGAVLWSEFVGQYTGDDFFDAGALYAEPFDAGDPVHTPTGLAAAPAGGTDPVLVNLGRAVQILDLAGVAVDAPLGDVQHAPRGDELVSVPGGGFAEGVTNVVGWSSFSSSTEPPLFERPDPVAEGSDLTADGYFVNEGTSFLMTVELTEDGPVGFAILTYGEMGDTSDPRLSGQTERFGAEEWRPILFKADDVAADPDLREYTVSG